MRILALLRAMPAEGKKVSARQRKLSASEKANQKPRTSFLRRKAKAKAKAQGKAKAKAKAKASPENSVELEEVAEPEEQWEDLSQYNFGFKTAPWEPLLSPSANLILVIRLPPYCGG